MNLNKIFYTPVWSGTIDCVTIDQLDDVYKFCMTECNNDSGKISSNVGGWQSKDYFYQQLTDTPLKSVLNIILDNINDCMKTMGSPAKVKFANIWMNVNFFENTNKLHTHGGVLSGVFYVKTPPNSGSIYFSREFDLANWFIGSIMSQHNTEASVTEMQLYPAERMLVLFPAWVPHGVKPHNTIENRVSISFNTQLDFGE